MFFSTLARVEEKKNKNKELVGVQGEAEPAEGSRHGRTRDLEPSPRPGSSKACCQPVATASILGHQRCHPAPRSVTVPSHGVGRSRGLPG